MRTHRNGLWALVVTSIAAFALSGCCGSSDSIGALGPKSPCVACGDPSPWKEYAAAASRTISCSCADPCCPAPSCASPCAPKPCCDPCGGRYTTVTERVCTQCETCTQVWVPPVKKLHPEPYQVRPACREVIETPAVCRTERTCCNPTSCCGELKTREVCVQPPSCHVCNTPAICVTDIVVCDEIPGHWETVTIPAVYENVMRVVCAPRAK